MKHLTNLGIYATLVAGVLLVNLQDLTGWPRAVSYAVLVLGWFVAIVMSYDGDEAKRGQ